MRVYPAAGNLPPMSETPRPDPIDIDALEVLARAATPGPWRSSVEGRDHSSGDNVILTPEHDVYPRVVVDDAQGNPNWQADQDFIAAANPEVVLSLIEILRQARG